MTIPILSVRLPSSTGVSSGATSLPIELPLLAPLTSISSWVSSGEIQRPLGLSVLRLVERETTWKYEQEHFHHHADPNSKRFESDDDDDSEDGENEEDLEEQRHQRQHQQNYARKKKHINLTEEDLQVDWYEVLNVAQKDGASDAQIRAAYRQRCLETHPDKQPNHSDELFKKVQRGFDILGDPDLRQNYDSSRPFDDTIPPEKVEEKEFFTAFAPVFERNKKWSAEPGLPSLGTLKTPYDEVMRFYNRWSGFRSWRDFSHLVELQEVSEDMCREEKRYYIRENERAVAHLKKEEMNRIKSLVERAKKNDPRIRRHIEQEEAKRQKEREEREAFRQKIREEAEKKRQAAEREEKAKTEAEKKEKEEAKQKALDILQSLIDFFRNHQLLDETPAKKLLPNSVRLVNIRWLIGKVSQVPGAAESILEKVTAASATPQPISAETSQAFSSGNEQIKVEVPAVLMFNTILQEREKELGVDRYGEPIKKTATATSASATVKPASSAPQKAAAVWTEEDLGRLQKATAKYPPGTVERWPKIVIMLREKFTEEEAMAKVSELTAALHAGGAANISALSSAGLGNQGGATAASNAPSSAAAIASASNSVEDWSVTQQKQLENGLRELKDYKEKDKFQKIAKGVDGKSAKDCFERYKYLCALKKR